MMMKSQNFAFIRFYSNTVIGVGVEEEDRKHTWMEDANSVSEIGLESLLA